jgi:hypothetical protein
MESITVASGQQKTERKSEKTSKLNLLEAIFYPFLKMNFAISIRLNQWREDRFSSLASSLTCWEAFFFSSSIALWLLPQIRTKNDIYWTASTLSFLFFCSLFGMYKWNMHIIYKSKLGSKISSKRNLGRLQIAGILLQILIFAGFLITVTLKAYWYHTRFFWWNQ